MKLWQISACLAGQEKIKEEYFGEIDFIAKGRDNAPEEKVISALSKSKLMYFVTPELRLRLYTGKETDASPITILEAYKRYGGDAITEVIDYGSYDVTNIKPL